MIPPKVRVIPTNHGRLLATRDTLELRVPLMEVEASRVERPGSQTQ
ncbi:MAG: hypothetical protein K0R53_1320, partial [Burkholderiales bacterium]|nr:hypothetical protein [Burkholderiales bacterium]